MIRLNMEWGKRATDGCGRALKKIHIIHAFHCGYISLRQAHYDVTLMSETAINQNKSKTDFITIIDPQAAFAIR